MTELRTPHLTDNAIPSAAMWNSAFRAAVAEIQDMMKFALWGDETPSAGAGGVMGGLVVDNVTGQLQSTVSPGMGWFYDSAIASPASKFGLIILKSTATVNHSAGDATYPRYDIVTIACPSGTDTELSVPRWQSSVANMDTQRGAEPALTVSEGTPEALPSFPSTPAGHLLLAIVYVPANAANLNAAVYTDSRIMRGVAKRDGDTNPVVYQGRDSTTNAKIFEVTTIEDVVAGLQSAMRWRASEDWPAFQRSTELTGEKIGTGASDWLYPMVIPGGRTWWRTVPWSLAYFADDVGNLDINRNALSGDISIARGSTLAGGPVRVSLQVATEARGLELVAARIRKKVATAFTTVSVSTIEIYIAHADGTTTPLGNENVIANSVNASPVVCDVDLDPTPVLVAGDRIVALYTLTLNSGGSAVGSIGLETLELQFKEGRTA